MIDKEVKIHLPCPCGVSSDAFTVYEDGHGYCFRGGCEKFFKAEELTDMFDNVVENESNNSGLSFGLDGNQAIEDRKILATTCKKYNVSITKDVAHYYPYYDVDGKHVANKVRKAGKDFTWEGIKKSATLFGQQLFPKNSSKGITITEGELDALACYQLLGSRYPAVSVHSASSAYKTCKQCYTYLDSFNEIAICFDNDEAGQKASQQVAELFPNKAKIMKLDNGFKDACDYLIAGKDHEFKNIWFSAEKYTPAGIVAGNSLYQQLKNKKKPVCLPLPWDALQDLTYGIRRGEMWTITAGSGMGKTQVLRELAYHIQKTTEDNIGMIFLEDTLDDSARGVMSISANKPIHIPTVEISDDEWDNAYRDTLGKNRYFFFDSFGSNDVDTIVNTIRYLALGCDCKYILLDHISILVSDQQQGDERKALDEIATKLKTLTIELDIWLGMVSHSKRPTGKSHEEGGQTSLSELRGTAGIGQLSNMVIGLERNGQDDDPYKRNVTLIRVLKNRFSGLTGPSSYLHYDRDTGRLTEVFPDMEEVEDFEEAEL